HRPDGSHAAVLPILSRKHQASSILPPLEQILVGSDLLIGRGFIFCNAGDGIEIALTVVDGIAQDTDQCLGRGHARTPAARNASAALRAALSTRSLPVFLF